MLEPELAERIRRIFLQPRPHVSIMTATRLLGWTSRQMTAAIGSGAIVLTSTPLGKWVWREDLVAKAFELWSHETIEEALGAEASILPAALRTRELRARLPGYHVDMLHYFAEQERTTVSHVLTRELDDLASANAEELSAAIPGFGVALTVLNGERRDDRPGQV
jgi:hypothetical protein